MRREILKCQVKRHTGEKPTGCAMRSLSIGRTRNVKRKCAEEKNHLYVGSAMSPFSIRPTRNVRRRYTQEKSPLPAGCVTRNSEMSCEDTHRRKACRMCDETFVSRTDQKSHEKMCTGQKPFACGMCNEAFVNWTYHKCHVKIHAGEKPFACMMCDMTY